MKIVLGLANEPEERRCHLSYLLNSTNSSHYLHIDFKCKQMNEVVGNDVCIHWHYIRALLALSLFVKEKTSNMHTKSNNSFSRFEKKIEKKRDRMIIATIWCSAQKDSSFVTLIGEKERLKSVLSSLFFLFQLEIKLFLSLISWVWLGFFLFTRFANLLPVNNRIDAWRKRQIKPNDRIGQMYIEW